MPKCIDCGAEISGAQEPDETRVSDGNKTWIETRCMICAENYAWAMWPDEQWGPYPSRVSRAKGRA